MKKHLTKRLLSLVVVLALCLGMMAVPGFAAEPNGLIVEKVDNSAVSAIFNNLKKYEGTAQETVKYGAHDNVRVSIVLGGKSTLELSNEKGFSLQDYLGNKTLTSHRANLLKDQQALAARISEEVLNGAELDVVWNLTLAANIISANVEYGQIEAIKAVKGVKDVVLECLYEPAVAEKGGEDPNMATSPVQTGSSNAWLSGYTGAGSRIAIIDTGTDTDHQSFDNGAFLYALAENAEKAGMTYDEYVASLDLLDAEEIAAAFGELNISVYNGLDPSWLYINDKLPFGFNYIDASLTVSHDRDQKGEHGSHVAGIATANRFIPVDNGYEPALESVYVQGVAPDAQLITMKVFGAGGGAYESDYMAAIEDAIVLKADAVNLSLGSAAPGFTVSPTYEDIMDALTESNLVAVMSGGNNYKWSEYSYYGTLAGLPYLFADDIATHTGGSPGAFTNSLAVASVENAGFTTLCVKVGDKAITYTETLADSQTNIPYGNAPLTSIGGEHEFVFIDGIGVNSDDAGNLFDNQFDAIKDIVEGKIALCYRGSSSFFEKANAAVAAGAIAVIIVNNQSGVINMALTGYEHTAPVVSILQTDGEYFKTGELQTTNGVNYWTGTMEVRSSVDVGLYDSQYYTMSDFSSWGVPGDLSLKPEITAPGGNIYSVFGSIPSISGAPANTATDKYELMSGTSMAAPQVTGMVALVMQHIRENGLSVDGLTDRALAMSLLMSTAVPMREEESGGNYYPILRQGSGLANVGAAVMANSYILMGEDATVSANDGKIKAELGDDPAKTGYYEFSFSINNMTDKAQGYTLSADFFTQGMFDYSGLSFLDTWTVPVASDVNWLVDGAPIVMVDFSANLDFDGDGDVDPDDGQALLDYATGARTELSNIEYADIDGDHGIDSYDAYLFFSCMDQGAVVIPANGSATVTVQVQLDTAMLDQYPTGAFVEGYVYADCMSTEEGVAGESHSIPVLGFYGNWTEPSMFDNYGYVYAGGYSNPISFSTNLLTLITGGREYLFGGNPMVADPEYYPERDALSSVNGDELGSYYFTSIRNAGNGLFLVTDAETGEIYAADEIGKVTSAYFSVSSATWNQYDLALGLGWNGAGIPNNTKVNVSLVLVPEYYAEADGSYDWANILPQLGEGAYLTTTMTIDNTAPELDEESLVIDEETKTLTFLAGDNQYVAAAALFDVYGQYLFDYTGSYSEANPGDVLEYALDLTEVNGASFLLQVYDYAGNTTTYKITQQIGEVVDTVDEVTISETSLTMIKGTTTTLTAAVMPINTVNRDFTWSTSDETVATVDENGVVTAVSAGEVTITATSDADETKSASCEITVIAVDYELDGVLLDAEANPYAFNWNLVEDSTWTKGAALGVSVAAAAGTGTEYAYILDASTNAIALVNTATGVTLGMGPALDGAMYDMSMSYLTDANQSDFLNMVSGSWILFAQDPTAPDYMGLNMAGYMSGYSGGTALVGVQTIGVSQDARGLFELIYALDDAGYIWSLRYYFQTGNISLGYISTDLDATYDLSYSYAYSSLVLSDDGEVFFLAQFDGNTSNLYMINSDFESFYVGNMGDGVWPAALTEARYYDGTATNGSAFENIESHPNWVSVAEDLYSTQMVTEVSAEGGLNSVSSNSGNNNAADVRPMSETEIDVENDTLVLNVTAKDTEGRDFASTNGVFTVTYDPASLALDSISVNGDYESLVIDEAAGVITIGYVNLAGIPAGETVATLTFTVTGEELHPVVEHQQANNYYINYTETAHDFGEWYTVYPATVNSDGLERRDCAYCDHYETRATFYYGAPGQPMPGTPAPEQPSNPGTPGGSSPAVPGVPGTGTMVPGPGHNCSVIGFSDLNAADWYHNAVDYVVANGIMNGTGNGSTFSPYMNMTRAMMMTILARMSGVDTSTGSTWYEVGMKWAVENGISDGTNPNADISREQLITMLYRYAGSPAVSSNNYLNAFSDGAKVSDWAKDAMNWAVSTGILQGKGNGTLDPQGLATRVEIAQILMNYANK